MQKTYSIFEPNGIIQSLNPINGEDVELMTSPVKCNYCGTTYDLTSVKVIHRYSDCTLFKTPCCDKMADDRKWKSLPDFQEVDLSKYTSH